MRAQLGGQEENKLPEHGQLRNADVHKQSYGAKGLSLPGDCRMVAFLTSAFLRTAYISRVCRLSGGYPNIVRKVLSGVSRMTLRAENKSKKVGRQEPAKEAGRGAVHLLRPFPKQTRSGGCSCQRDQIAYDAMPWYVTSGRKVG